MIQGYARAKALRITKVSAKQLQLWRETGLVTPSALRSTVERSPHLYSFSDLVALRTLGTLRQAGISLQALRKVAEVLRNQDPPRSFTDTFLVSDGTDVFIREGRTMISALKNTGQTTHMLFVLDLGAVEQELTAEIHQEEKSKAA